MMTIERKLVNNIPDVKISKKKKKWKSDFGTWNWWLLSYTLTKGPMKMAKVTFENLTVSKIWLESTLFIHCMHHKTEIGNGFSENMAFDLYALSNAQVWSYLQIWKRHLKDEHHLKHFLVNKMFLECYLVSINIVVLSSLDDSLEHRIRPQDMSKSEVCRTRPVGRKLRLCCSLWHHLHSLKNRSVREMCLCFCSSTTTTYPYTAVSCETHFLVNMHNCIIHALPLQCLKKNL